ncbi:MAG: LacI family DNA-binding transcriptional regulator, partial [Acidimicrobiales bacterium]
VIPDINNPLFPPMVRGVEDRLFQDGFVALLGNTESDSDRQRRIFEGMVDRRVDGLVLATARRHDVSIGELVEHGIPVVLLNRVVEDRALPSVSVDDAAGICMVVEHLRSLGHERIAHIAGPQSMSTGFARYNGFVSEMQKTGAAHDERFVAFAGSFSIAEGDRCASRLLVEPDRPTAIIAGNDMLALGCYSAVERAGLRCPEDVSIVGFNDMPFIDRVNPPLTTVRIPHYDLGVHAAELLLGRLREPEAPFEVVHFPPQLVVRGSTASARE